MGGAGRDFASALARVGGAGHDLEVKLVGGTGRDFAGGLVGGAAPSSRGGSGFGGALVQAVAGQQLLWGDAGLNWPPVKKGREPLWRGACWGEQVGGTCVQGMQGQGERR